MLNVFFALGALGLFTIGFFLVKKGRPFARVGGDAYTKRRRRRMLGWMMWTTAAVLLLLVVINLASTGMPAEPSVAQSGARPDMQKIPRSEHADLFIPNLIHAPALVADPANTSLATNTSSAIPPALDLSMSERPPLLTTTLVTPLPAPTLATNKPDSALESKAGLDSSAGAAPDAPPARAMRSPAPLSPERQKQLDAQLAAVNLVLQKDPKNIGAYILRGNVFAYERKWSEAKSNYQQALVLAPRNPSACYNLADIDFMLGRYDAARPAFASLEQDPDFGDLAKYNVFLCDLFGGHEEQAAKELAVFNDVASEASYYFANVAWSFYHQKNDDAQNWLQSATQIFSQAKVNLYSKPLIDLGYINS